MWENRAPVSAKQSHAVHDAVLERRSGGGLISGDCQGAGVGCRCSVRPGEE